MKTWGDRCLRGPRDPLAWSPPFCETQSCALKQKTVRKLRINFLEDIRWLSADQNTSSCRPGSTEMSTVVICPSPPSGIAPGGVCAAPSLGAPRVMESARVAGPDPCVRSAWAREPSQVPPPIHRYAKDSQCISMNSLLAYVTQRFQRGQTCLPAVERKGHSRPGLDLGSRYVRHQSCREVNKRLRSSTHPQGCEPMERLVLELC